MPKSNQNSSENQEFHSFQIKQDGPITIISMHGMTKPNKMHELDSVFEHLIQCDCVHVILDLSETRLLHSYEIGAIIRYLQYVEKGSGSLAFVNPSDRVRYLLETACILDLVPVHANLEIAIQTIKPALSS